MTMRTLLHIFFITLGITAAQAQIEVGERAGWRDRVFVGGGGGLGGGTDVFGNRFFRISVSPVIGYMVTDKVSMGTSVVYNSINYSDLGFRYKQYGIMPFIRYNLDDLFLTAEWNYLNVPRLSFNGNYDVTERLNVTRMLAGAGYSKPIGGRSRVNVVGLYDLAYKRQYFASPWVLRVFFTL